MSLTTLLAVLCCWRITQLLHLEHGPWGSITALRRVLVRLGLGGVVGCFACLSVWVAAGLALALAPDLRQGLLLWGATSGGALLLQRWTEAQHPPPSYLEDPETPP